MPGSARGIWSAKLFAEDTELWMKVHSYTGIINPKSTEGRARWRSMEAYFRAARDIHKRSDVLKQTSREITIRVHELRLSCGHTVQRAVAKVGADYEPKWLWCEICNDAGRKKHNMRTPARSPVTVMKTLGARR